MSTPTQRIRRDVRVFVSAVTRELGTVREVVKNALLDMDHHAVEQRNFPPDYRDLIDKLRERIDSCEAVVHIAGRCYGSEPAQRPPDAPRRSYTQLEYDIAVERKKPIYVFLTGDGFPADPHDPETPELRELQQAHRDRLTSSGKDYNPTTSVQELDQKVRSLQIQVKRLTGELRRVDQKVVVAALLSTIVLGSLIAVAYLGLGRAARDVGNEVGQIAVDVNKKLVEMREQFADPDLLAGKIKSHIRKRAEEEIAAGKARAPEDWSKRNEIEKRRDQALERVDDLVRSIREGLAGVPDPVFVAAAEVLDRHGVDETIKFLEQKQPAINNKISEAKSFRDQADERLRAAYRPKTLQADLYETNMRWPEALEIREEVARENPRWFEAQTALGNLLARVGMDGKAELPLKAALALAAKPEEKAAALNNLAELFRATKRVAEAEPLYRLALAIDERAFGPADRKVAANLNNLGLSLQATNSRAAAEPLFRRALAIDEKSSGPTDIEDATDLNNLGLLLKETNRIVEAEPLFRRALPIVLRTRGPDHPEVATHLNNLAQLMQATDRAPEAEALYRRAVAIAERSYGPDNPDVATYVGNLAILLMLTDRLDKAEPLMRRAIAIFARFQRSNGSEHPFMSIAAAYYRQLLAQQKLSEPEIAARINSAG
jgi:tetratricopeptide (TPR) repeat protein